MYEHSLYLEINENCDLLLIYLNADDLIFEKNNPKLFKEFKMTIAKEFKMKMIYLCLSSLTHTFDKYKFNK